MNAKEFNDNHYIGTIVRYYPVDGETEFSYHSTRTEAQVVNDRDVVWLNGKTGYVLLSHCDTLDMDVRKAKSQPDIHDTLDFIVARYVAKTGKRLSDSTIMELIEFSYKEFCK
jgi:hypothetical protein